MLSYCHHDVNRTERYQNCRGLLRRFERVVIGKFRYYQALYLFISKRVFGRYPVTTTFVAFARRITPPKILSTRRAIVWTQLRPNYNATHSKKHCTSVKQLNNTQLCRCEYQNRSTNKQNNTSCSPSSHGFSLSQLYNIIVCAIDRLLAVFHFPQIFFTFFCEPPGPRFAYKLGVNVALFYESFKGSRTTLGRKIKVFSVFRSSQNRIVGIYKRFQINLGGVLRTSSTHIPLQNRYKQIYHCIDIGIFKTVYCFTAIGFSKTTKLSGNVCRYCLDRGVAVAAPVENGCGDRETSPDAAWDKDGVRMHTYDSHHKKAFDRRAALRVNHTHAFPHHS